MGPRRHPPLEQKVGDQMSSPVCVPSVTGLLSARRWVKSQIEEVRKPCVGGRHGPQKGCQGRSHMCKQSPAKRE